MITASVPSAPPETIELARTTLHDQVGAAAIGEFIGAYSEADDVYTVQFASTESGYPGWEWAVTIVALPDEVPTVDEVVLLPGSAAIVAPAWVPWRERIQPGDLSPGDLLPVEEDDPRLVPTYLAGDEEVDEQVAATVVDEIGLGRSRVLSMTGRDSAVQRWYAGPPGPHVPLAQSAPAKCESCGFMLRLAGPMSTVFGVCANEHANDDARVVSFDHGCGAHSQAQLRKRQQPVPLADPVFDTLSEDDFEQF